MGCFKSLFHTLVAGVGFLSDAYDLFVVNTVVVILAKVYPAEDVHGESAVATAAVLGSVFGQIAFGFLADKIGRRKGFIATLTLVVVGALASSATFHTASISIYATLAGCRLVLGVGIGGEYPLSATISSESSEAHQRGRQVAAVFSMQGFGMLLAPCLAVVLMWLLPGRLDVVWRLLLGLGALPGLAMFYWRCKMPETSHFERAAGKQRHSTLSTIRKNWKTLVGTAGTWFIFDITFYANGLFSTTIIEDTGFGTGPDHHATVMGTTQLNILLVLMAIPGYFAAIALIDRIGRRKLQMGGFAGMAVCYLIMGLLMPVMKQSVGLFFVFYGLSFFFSNCGPNTTTFVIPSEAFPTEIRATCHGLSAAAGKLGAVLGGAALRPLMQTRGLAVVMIVCGITALLGLVVTFFFTKETMNKALHAVTYGQLEEDHGHSGNSEGLELATGVNRSAGSMVDDADDHQASAGAGAGAGSGGTGEAAAAADEGRAAVAVEEES